MSSCGDVILVEVTTKMKTLSDDERHEKVEVATEGILSWLGVAQQWRIRLEFVDEFPEARGHRSGAVASIDEDYPYRTLTLTWVRTAVDGYDLEMIEELTLHELLHILLFGDAYRFSTIYAQEHHRTNEWMDIEESAVDLAAHFLARLKPEDGWK